MTERMFPVLYAGYWEDDADVKAGAPRAVPWSLLAPHEDQAKQNHGGQTLEVLASRGGLGLDEMVAIIEGRRWRRMVAGAARMKIMALLDPCPECKGKGWHVGECHPYEQCGACDGTGRRAMVIRGASHEAERRGTAPGRATVEKGGSRG